MHCFLIALNSKIFMSKGYLGWHILVSFAPMNVF
jgi:hypothetical protein